MQIFTTLRLLHATDAEFWEVITLCAQVEWLGLIHCEVNLCVLSNTVNPHITFPHHILIRDTTSSPDLLPEAFFLRGHPDHHWWSVGALLHWLRDENAIVNIPTGTIYCGPLGVRMVILSLSRIITNLHSLQTVSGLTSTTPSNNLGDVNVNASLSTCQEIIYWLKGTLQHTIAALQEMFDTRSHLWEQRILALEHIITLPEAVVEHDTSLRATSDIPCSLHTIHAMVNELKAWEKEQEEALDEIENSIMAGEQTIHGADIDDANEEEISNVANVLKELAVTPSEPEHVVVSEVVTSSVPPEETPEKEMPVEPEMVVASQKDAPVQGEPAAADNVPETSGSSTKNLEAVTTWLRPRK
ncbi:hypothetical protein FRC11_012589 [Ceratobasidium sp. 423]|nr:hypothetical protein FRC11_012589 [Ceratobasidium sp. 423]